MIAQSVSALEPGFACVRVAPEVGELHEDSGIVTIPDGAVEVSWSDSPIAFILNVNIPIGIHLQVRLPATLQDDLFVDGEPIAQDTQVTRDDRFVELAVLPGNRYQFEVRKRR